MSVPELFAFYLFITFLDQLMWQVALVPIRLQKQFQGWSLKWKLFIKKEMQICAEVCTSINVKLNLNSISLCWLIAVS